MSNGGDKSTASSTSAVKPNKVQNSSPGKANGNANLGWSIGCCPCTSPPHLPPHPTASPVLSAACASLNFSIAEIWLRTGPKTHQLINSHLRPHSLNEESMKVLTEVYYGASSSLRTHRLSPALCKRAKDSNDIVWLTSDSTQELTCAISDIATAVACPVCNESLGLSLTVIFFSLRQVQMDRKIVEFVFHMSLAAGVASAGWGSEENGGKDGNKNLHQPYSPGSEKRIEGAHPHTPRSNDPMSRSQGGSPARPTPGPDAHSAPTGSSPSVVPSPSVNPNPPLDVKWSQLENVEYLTDGGNTWIHTATYASHPVVVKTLKPECQDVALAINELESELLIHSKLRHSSICQFLGSGQTSKGMRFLVLERLDGGTLTQVLGYDTRIRDRRRRFWKRRQMPYLEVLAHAHALASAVYYLHSSAIPGSVIMHRDLKPDNVGFTLAGELKLIDFGLAKVIENADAEASDVYRMSGETGSLRYMAPEVASNAAYNQTADVYSLGVILWEMTSYKKPYEGLTREAFYRRVVQGGERPPISKKWPRPLGALMQDCWSVDVGARPSAREVVERLGAMLAEAEKGQKEKKGLGALIDRHSTWF
eukprot:CAMPEP_0182479504 /NCGR_PEP_ID=MMETSP1319-20130603/34306_1 /TAXON_ID=172717 /ORGANISM="Bolidomonas pacifica, Strain RCC208" /LENGTH=592 /DNA_ID=CAMNT_0024680931 /DNA_START=252 /DNA_END=2030 /DNA_ORIENTATION=+